MGIPLLCRIAERWGRMSKKWCITITVAAVLHVRRAATVAGPLRIQATVSCVGRAGRERQ